MKLLEGKVAIVTGAARGIGKAIALKLASEGAAIAFTDLNIDENALNTQKEIEALGVKAKGYASNAANFEETHTVVDEIVKEFGRVDILVNNAGITNDKLSIRMKAEDFDSVIKANLTSAFIGCREALKAMSKNRFGSVVNISSIIGETGNAGQTNYSASKGGMITMTKSFAFEGAARAIRYNCITPGFIETDMTKELKEEIKEFNLARIPLKRFGKPSEVASAVAFLLSDEASYITGETLKVNGGMLM